METPLRKATRLAKKRAGTTPCRWFALCDRPATKTEPHPVLGEVPICDRCAQRVASMR